MGSWVAGDCLPGVFCGGCIMKRDKLVFESECHFDDHSYQIKVYCRLDGRHYAKTLLGENDFIVNDGVTLNEVLAIQHEILPLAVSNLKSHQAGKRDREET